MKIFKRIFTSLVVLIFVIIIGVYIYLRSTAPEYSGAVTVDGLKAEVQILYDNYGVPHIHAQNEEDAYFALGYQDR